MPFLLNIIARSVIGGLICLIPSEGIIFSQAEVKGYRDIIFYDGKFLAVGTEGRIDYLNNSGERTPVVNTCINKLNCIISEDRMLVAAGDHGTILFSSDGQVFTKVESGTDKNIYGITFKNGLFIAGAENGTILISKNGRTWSRINLETRGDIVSVAANDSFCIGVTDSGEIIRSYDGLSWEITDFNKKYSGYYKPCIFRKTLLTINRIVLIGKHDDGSPAVFFSSQGNVWTERLLTYNDDQGMISKLTNLPNDIDYDPARDQFFLACDKGEIFSLPSCTKCNISVKVSTNDFQAIICQDDLLLTVGEGFSVNILKL